MKVRLTKRHGHPKLVVIMTVVFCSVVPVVVAQPRVSSVASPDGGLVADFYLDAAGAPRYAVRLDGKTVLRESGLGLVGEDADRLRAGQGRPPHATVLPFTRNVFDLMDFTPVVLDRVPRIERRATSAFELALAVLFTSGIQHYAEIPEGMSKAPPYVRDFLREVPAVCDDTKFLDGYPGRYVALARRGGGRWYVAGIDGEATPRRLTLDLDELRSRGAGTLIADGDGGNLSFRRETVRLAGQKKLEVALPPRGGFVLLLD